MKKVMIVAGTYYPDSMATIAITQRFAEALASNDSYRVDVFVARPYLYPKKDYPSELNGVIITDRDDIEQSNSLLFKLLRVFNRLLKKVNRILKGKLFIYKSFSNYLHQKDMADRICRVMKEKSIDEIVTIALPFSIHRIGHYVKKQSHEVKWTTINFDPYAYDEVTNAGRKEKCIKEEDKILKTADKVMFLSQFANDYARSKFIDKITYFELPNIRQLKYIEDAGFIDYDEERINCVFLGNLYLIQRHPKFMFELFEAFRNTNIVLHIVGDLIDIPKEYIDFWKTKLGDRLVLAGRVSQQTAINSMFGADVLINVGHATTNQCPSKILDYMSIGKPILNISKIDSCTSLPLLKKYPLTYTLYEKNGINREIVSACEAFLLSCKQEKAILSFDDVLSIFGNYTMDEMIKRFEQ